MSEFKVNLPAGLPEPPDDGLEAMGFDAEMPDGSHNGYFGARAGDDKWYGCGPSTVRVGGICRDVFILRRPPAKPQVKTVPFDRIKDFGDVFPIYVIWKDAPTVCTPSHYRPRSIEIGGVGLAYSALVKDEVRWSTSPLTPWSECKPFTKEVSE